MENLIKLHVLVFLLGPVDTCPDIFENGVFFLPVLPQVPTNSARRFPSPKTKALEDTLQSYCIAF